MKKLQEKADALRLGLYVHVPFCARSCDFCHFYQEPPRRADLDRYLEGIELSLSRAHLPRSLDTVFWGGGTPGLLSSADLQRLGRAVIEANGGRVPHEWTVEMAPATVKADKLKCLMDLGVTRISMGVQSFQPDLLEALGRIHSLEQVKRSVELLHHVGMTNFNLDLIFAIPGQDHVSWKADLKSAVAADPAHISTYCLTFEEDTALWLRLQRGQVHKIDADEEAGFFEIAWEFLKSRGFVQYEVSNYARPGHACEHNLDTWRMQEWLGVGPSASSQLNGRRWTEPHSLDDWLEGLNGGPPKWVDSIELTSSVLAQDFLIFGLRMNEGVDLQELEARFPGALAPSWPGFRDSLIEAELAEQGGSRLCLTETGRLVADRIGEEILGLA